MDEGSRGLFVLYILLTKCGCDCTRLELVMISRRPHVLCDSSISDSNTLERFQNPFARYNFFDGSAVVQSTSSFFYHESRNILLKSVS
jgi:hypothetical protein